MIEINLMSRREVVPFPLGIFRIHNDANSVISYLQSRAVFILSEGSLLDLWSVSSKSAEPFGELALLMSITEI